MPRSIIRAWKVLTLNAAQPVIDNGAVIVEGDSIEAVGGFDDLSSRGPFEFELGSQEHVLLPGFVNAHFHVGNTFRMGVPDGPLERWILLNHGAKVEDAEEAVYDFTLYFACELLRAGVTCCIDNMPIKASLPHFGVEPAIKAYADAGLRVTLAPIVRNQNALVHGDTKAFLATLPPRIAQALQTSPLLRPATSDDDYLATMQALFRTHHGSAAGRINIFLSPSGPQWCSDALLRSIKRAAQEWGAGIQLHVLESRYQMQYARHAYGVTAIAHLEELGFLGDEVSCAHTVWVTDDDVAKLANSGATVVHNPASNLRLSSGIARIRDLLAAGVPVAFGTDGMSFNGANDLLSDVRLASFLQRLPGLQTAPIDAATWLEIATLRGAKAAGFGGVCGSLEAGKRADLVLVNAERLRAPFLHPRIPIQDVVLQLASGSDVDTVIINGQPVVKERRILTIDEAALAQRIRTRFGTFNDDPNEDAAFQGDILQHVEAYYRSWDEEPLEGNYRYNTR